MRTEMSDESIDKMVLTDDDKKGLAKAFLAEKILYNASLYVDNTGLA